MGNRGERGRETKVKGKEKQRGKWRGNRGEMEEKQRGKRGERGEGNR